MWGDLDPGPYAVGFNVEYLLDTTRHMISSDSLPHVLEGRPIRIKVYYPGEIDKPTSRLRFWEQINVFPKNPQFGIYNTMLNVWDNRLQGQFSPRSDSLMQILMNTETMAYKDISVAKNKFPLLVYELGLDDHQMENSIMWEYMASHGYVVAVIPSFGESLDKRFTDYSAEGIATLSNDADYTISYMKSKSYVNPAKIGAIGHSFGGLVVNDLASKNEDVQAIACLDASINLTRGKEVLETSGLDPNSIKIPVLNLFTLARSNNDFSYIESLDTDVYQFGFYKASHFDFQNWPLYAVITNTQDPRVRRTSEEGKQILMGVIGFTKRFFDFTLKDDKEIQPFLKGEGREAQELAVLGEFKK